MVTVRNIDDFFNSFAPKELSESYDNDGIMLCENLDKRVSKVLCALEVTPELVSYACDNKFDLIVTHHPLIFNKLSRLDERYADTTLRLIKSGITVLSYHTRLDSANGGVNDCLANLVGLSDVHGFGGDSGVIGRVGSIEAMSFEKFGKLLLSKLDCKNIRACDGGRRISKVALIGGAGKDFIFEAHLSGADAYVTSEIPHHLYAEAKRIGLSVFDCGHYYTENCIANQISALINKEFAEIETQVFDVGNSYTCIQ